MATLRTSEKHGVNPTIPTCFFCGESKNEVALLGKLKGDAKAPMHMILDYEPCDACQEKFDQGILLVGVSTVPPSDGCPPIYEYEGQKLYPEGGHVVMTEDGVRRLMIEGPMVEQVIKMRKSFVDKSIIEMVQAYHEDTEKETEQ